MILGGHTDNVNSDLFSRDTPSKAIAPPQSLSLNVQTVTSTHILTNT